MTTESKASGAWVAVKVAGATLAAEWARLPWCWSGLIFFICLDVLTGLAAGRKLGETSSNRAYQGARKKSLMILVVAGVDFFNNHIMGHIPLSSGFGVIPPIPGISSIDPPSAFALYFIYGEVVSIVENCKRGGLDLPPVLNTVLSKASGILGVKMATLQDEQENNALRLKQKQESAALSLSQSQRTIGPLIVPSTDITKEPSTQK